MSITQRPKAASRCVPARLCRKPPNHSKNNLKYKTLITQEFLKKNILASNLMFMSTAHKKEHIDLYLYHLEKIFRLIADCENGLDIKKLLKTRSSQKGFKRFN